MSSVVTAYPVAGKAKSREICDAFVAGAKRAGATAAVATNCTALLPGAAFFYGVDKSNVAVWDEVRRTGRDFYYCDNAYFDQCRQTYFRVSKNALQHSGLGDSDCRRFDALGVGVKPWREGGQRIVLCPQSDHFMRTVVGVSSDWTKITIEDLRTLTSRSIVVRDWSPDKAALGATLEEDLNHAHALVTWSSAAAITAVLHGVPIVVMGDCAARPMAGPLSAIEALPRPSFEARRAWAGVLADQQWTLEEFRAGDAWRAVA